MVATGFILLMTIVFGTSFLFLIPSIIGLIACKSYKKKKGKKAKLIIRIILSIMLILGLIMFTIPSAFGCFIISVNHDEAKSNLTLESAAEIKDITTVKYLLKKGTNPDENSGDNYSPLTHACTGVGSYEIAKLLIDYNCTVDMEFNGYSDGNEKGYTPLMYAVSEKENYNIIKLLIENNADVNHKASSDGSTPLMLAIIYENYEGANLLITKSADTKAIDNKGTSILEYACSRTINADTYTMISTLLENGASINTDATELDNLISTIKDNTTDTTNEYCNKIIELLMKYK